MVCCIITFMYSTVTENLQKSTAKMKIWRLIDIKVYAI